MASFRFPPPPPPPPRAAASDDAPQYASNQRGGFDNGRGGRGRGQRGRGWLGRGGNNSRGGYGQGRGGSHANEQSQYGGGSRGGFSSNAQTAYQQQGFPQGPPHSHQQQQFSPPQNAYPLHSQPAGAYINPNFIPQQVGGQNQWLQQTNSAAVMQEAVPSISAFTTHMTSAPQTPQSLQHPSGSRGKNKRKRNERPSGSSSSHVSPPAQNQKAKQKPPRAKAAVPPAVPSFGFSIPTPTNSVFSSHYKQSVPKKPRVDLGFTAKQESEEESGTEEEIDEEAVYKAQFKGISGLVFEHNGEMISIQTPEEMAAWVKDRRKKYPTQKRIVEKAAETLELRKRELEFLQKHKPGDGVSSIKRLGRMRIEEAPATQELNAAEQIIYPPILDNESEEILPAFTKMLKAVERNIGSAKPAVDLALGYSSDSDDESSILSDSSVVSDSEDSSEDDSDSGPEEQSSKIQAEPKIKQEPDIKEPDRTQAPNIKEEPGSEQTPNVKTESKAEPPATSAPVPAVHQAGRVVPNKGNVQVCSQFQQTGKCKYGWKCKWEHPVKEEKKRKTLYETMVEKEVEQADRLALDAIKYLGRNGFLG